MVCDKTSSVATSKVNSKLYQARQDADIVRKQHSRALHRRIAKSSWMLRTPNAMLARLDGYLGWEHSAVASASWLGL